MWGWGREGLQRGDKLLFWAQTMVRFNLEPISEHPITQSGQCGEGGRRKVGGGGREQRNNRWWMDGDQVHFPPLWEVSRCCVGRPHNSPGFRLRGVEVWCAQPCLPRGPPCLRRQDPSSVSKAIFTNAWKLLLLSLRLSCEGMKHRQIPSLGTQQSQHLISTPCARHREVPNHWRPIATLGNHVVCAQIWLAGLKWQKSSFI